MVVFVIEGVNVVIGVGFDLFGVMVLLFVVVFGGGVICDLLIGVCLLSVVSDWCYLVFVFVVGLFVFVFYVWVVLFLLLLLMVFDVVGFVLFVVVGVVKVLEFCVYLFIVMLMGVVIGCGGGVVCDLLFVWILVVLVIDIYVSVVLFGVVVVVLCW